LRNVKNETSYFENGLKNRFRAIAFRADEHFPNRSQATSSLPKFQVKCGSFTIIRISQTGGSFENRPKWSIFFYQMIFLKRNTRLFC
jgi:hypothetical protein